MYEKVFTPIQLAGTRLANRIVRTAHGTGLVGEDLIAYHEARARGGVALSILGASGVHASSVTPDIPLHDDGVVDFYDAISKRVHRHGMKLFQQLWHGGSAYPPRTGRGAQWSSSAVPNPMVGGVPEAMNTHAIEELVEAHASAAARVKRGGLDGVEIHAAHNYLVAQFLSPALNHRDDEYGGPLENRMRLLREIIAAIRSTVGADFPLGVRLVSDEFIDGGLEAEESAEVARRIEDDIDFLDVSLGGYWRFHQIMASTEEPLGYELPHSSQVTSQVSVPTMVTGRIMSLSEADRVLGSGQADMVSMVRALIADPDLVNKTRDRREDRVRPCISTNVGCQAGLFTGRFGCVVNVAAGREATIPFEPARAVGPRKRVLVIGGGPAGMETARTAALRGHHVELHEARRALGGQLAIAASVPERSDLGSLSRWLESEIERLDVTIRRSSFVDPDMVREMGADEVVMATGAMPLRETPPVLTPGTAIPGSRRPHVATSWEALGFGGSVTSGDAVVLYDDTGTFEALTVALRLVARGASLTYISRHAYPGEAIPFPPATVDGVRERLMDGDVEVLPKSTIVEIGARDVVVRSVYGRRTRRLAADTVILVGYQHPNRELAQELDAMAIPYHLVGDVNGTQDLRRAVREAAYVGRAI